MGISGSSEKLLVNRRGGLVVAISFVPILFSLLVFCHKDGIALFDFVLKLSLLLLLIGGGLGGIVLGTRTDNALESGVLICGGLLCFGIIWVIWRPRHV